MSSSFPSSSGAPFVSAGTRYPNYDDELELCKNFVTKDPDMRETLQSVADRKESVVEIDLLSVGQIVDAEFVERIQNNVLRYIELFSDAIMELLPPEEVVLDYATADTLDIFIAHRIRNAQKQLQDEEGGADQDTDVSTMIPKELRQRFEVKIISTKHPLSIREIRSKDVGHLVNLTGIVTRVTKVKPHVRVATYACDRCDMEVYQSINTNEFMPLTTCSSPVCREAGTPGTLTLGTRGSKFVRFQEIRVQELSDQVPAGHIPRSLIVKAHGACTRQCGPGDTVQISGVFMPTPYHGFAKLRAGLLSDTYIEAMQITKEKKSYQNETATPLETQELEEMARNPKRFEILSQSIAPAIYGHEDVKKALLLLLMGGASRDLPDGMKIRGDINVCLMGDPGVAKSQLLKFITRAAPRGVYTTGKGSSGVGLTAAVQKDPVTNEFVLEGGALVLADKGICCIDEFDKMEEGDRTAIHEVMEQQTISIAKAGIMTTLNARTSILAAANPMYGRYNRAKSASENINLPAALLSRFDILWLIIDEPNLDDDLRLAKHIAYVHQNSKQPPLEFEPKDAVFLRRYIAMAKTYNPYVPNELTEFITERYVAMRIPTSSTQGSTTTTARTLLAILRLSTACARLRFSDSVNQEDVEEAIRLMYMSKASILEESRKSYEEKLNPVDAIYRIVRNQVSTSEQSVQYDQVLRFVCAKGYTPEQLEESLEEYEELNVLRVDAKRTRITFI